MKAHSSQTGRTYDSWEDLLAAEANGYGVVVMMQATSGRSGRTRTYSRVIGPFADRETARTKAAAARRSFKRAEERRPRNVQLLGVRVEPIWAELRFDAD